MAQLRLDHTGTHRVQYTANKKKIMKMENTCGICGGYVDKKIKYPDPKCGVIDHIIPISRGGHPSDINNLQLAHHICNQKKADTIFSKNMDGVQKFNNENFPKSLDWRRYRANY